MPTHNRRGLPRTPEALADFLGELLRRRRILAEQQQASTASTGASVDATSAEIAFLDEVLSAVVKQAPWQALDRAYARRDDVALAGAVKALATFLDGARRRFPTWQAFRDALRKDHELIMGVLSLAYAFPDLAGPDIRAVSPHRGRLEGDGIPPSGVMVLIEGEEGASPTRERDPYPVVQARANRLHEEIDSADVLECLYGKEPGEPHGPVAAAELVVSRVTGVSRQTIRRARKELADVPK